MSKIALYLQEHIAGEVSVNHDTLDGMSRDGSVLRLTPEMVVFPRTTDDIRKVARFCWQLAEKGHALPITARGSGSDQTGASIGNGVLLSFPSHMSSIFEFEPRSKLVRVQPGTNARALNDALWMRGASIPALSTSSPYGTVGGAVANNSPGDFSGKYGCMTEWVDRLEVVLANGEVIQTGRISKRELNRKKGLGSLEGEVYRSVDNLISDNEELIRNLKTRSQYTNAGYMSIANVKQKDGSFDLTPLFTGSQGTLGIICEMILKTTYTARDLSVVLAVFEDKDAARDSVASLMRYEPAFIDSYSGDLFRIAERVGKGYSFIEQEGSDIGAVLLVGFDDSSNRTRAKRTKRAEKVLRQFGGWVKSADSDDAAELLSVRSVLGFSLVPDGAGKCAPPVLDGIYVPPEQFPVFAAGIATISEKYRLAMPLFGHELMSLYYAWPVFTLKKPSDKQKIMKLIDDLALLVEKTGGELVGQAGEGRLKARQVQSSFDQKTADLFTAIKNIFDPYGIMNPGVKQVSDSKQLESMLSDDFRPPFLPNYSPSV